MFRYTAPELHDVFLGHHVEWGWVKGNLPQQPFSPQTSECGPEEFVQFNGKGPCVTAPWDNKVNHYSTIIQLFNDNLTIYMIQINTGNALGSSHVSNNFMDVVTCDRGSPICNNIQNTNYRIFLSIDQS